MSRHDEHGDVDIDPPEHGPEWWAMGREFCTCGHHYDAHLLQHRGPGEFVTGTCLEPDCECREFHALDNQ